MLGLVQPRASGISMKDGAGTCWGPPIELYEELIHRYAICGVVDLTPADALLASVCMCQCPDVPYVGMATDATHRAALQLHLKKLTLKSFVTDGSRFFRKELCDVLSAEAAGDNEDHVTQRVSRL